MNQQIRLTTNLKIKLAIGICLFLTLAPVIGSFIPADTRMGKIVGHFTPYIHLTMPQLSGLPFAESAGGLYGIFIFLTGLTGLILYFFKQTNSILRILLYLTLIYCILRALGAILANALFILRYQKDEIIFVIAAIITDFAWGLLCYWATKTIKRSNK